MFQNISMDVTENFQEVNKNSKKDIKNIIKTMIKGQSILLYIFSFMLSCIDGLGLNYSIFAIAIFAGAISNGIPMGILYILTMIGTLIKFQTAGLLAYLFTTAVFIVLILMFKPKKLLLEYENEKMKLGKYVFIAVLLGQVIKLFFQEFLVYDLLVAISSAMTAYIFYKIFSKSIIVINEIKNKKVFSIEEVMGATLLVAIASTCLGDMKLLGLQVGNIISILLVLILGWKNGILIGTTSGVTVGVVLGIITNSNPILIAVFALSGMLAGILSKFGKLGVIVGFIAGNLLLTYVYNGQLVELICFKEILVASLALILVPNKIEIHISDLFGKDELLPEGPTYRLQESKETVDKLNNVSDVIKQMSTTYKEVAKSSIEEKDILENNKEIFIEELQDNIRQVPNNILYQDLLDENENIVQDIFEYLLEKDRITREDLLEIFKKYNNYIIGFDNYETSLKIEKDISQVIQIINDSFKTSKLNFIMAAKIGENNKNISMQLDGVSKAIDTIANEIDEPKDEFLDKRNEILLKCKQRQIDLLDVGISREKTGRYIIKAFLNTCSDSRIIECPTKKIEQILSETLDEEIIIKKEKCGIKQEQKMCYQTYLSKDNYGMQIGIAKTNKDGENISGDSSLQISLEDGKYLMAISDGMGSGPNARKSSQIAIKMLGRLLSNGFDKETSIELINNTISSNIKDETYATLDIMVLDLYAGNIEYIKNGACPTFIKNNKNVDIIKNIALPAGILNNIDLVVYDRDVEDNDIIVMCSDGIIESNSEYKNKELWVKDLLEQMETTNAQKIADILLKEAIDNNYGKAKDDMTVIVTKIMKK